MLYFYFTLVHFYFFPLSTLPPPYFESSVVLDCVHHFCYGKDGNHNIVEVVHHYYRILRQRCCELADSENGKGRKRSLKCRRSANGLICLLNIRKDGGEEK